MNSILFDRYKSRGDKLFDHLKHMADTRPGADGESAKWAVSVIEELRNNVLKQ